MRASVLLDWLPLLRRAVLVRSTHPLLMLHPRHRSAERLRALCVALELDAILLVTGWDGCHNLGSRGLAEWLCEPMAHAAAVTPRALREDALEEGLFIVSPAGMQWAIASPSPGDDGDGSGGCGDGDMDVDGSSGAAAVAAADSCCAGGACTPMQVSTAHDGGAGSNVQRLGSNSCCGADVAADCPVSAHPPLVSSSLHPGAAAAAGPDGPDAKMALLLPLLRSGSLRRVGVPLGVEVLNGRQRAVCGASILRWPLLLAAAEACDVQPEQLFQVRSCMRVGSREGRLPCKCA